MGTDPDVALKEARGRRDSAREHLAPRRRSRRGRKAQKAARADRDTGFEAVAGVARKARPAHPLTGRRLYVGRAYNRTTHLAERQDMTQRWAD